MGTLYSRGRNYQPCMLQTVYDERTLSGVFVWIMHKLLLQHPQWCCGEHITRTASPGLGMDLLIRPFLHNLLRNTIFDNFYKKCLICVRTFKKTFTLLGRTMGFNRSQRYEFCPNQTRITYSIQFSLATQHCQSSTHPQSEFQCKLSQIQQIYKFRSIIGTL